MTRQPPTTLLRLFEDSGRHVLVYDIGRRVGAIGRGVFARFESAAAPYPLPMQRKARFALVQIADDAESVVWFLQFALDEQGLIVPAERDYLLVRLLESAQAGQAGGDPQRVLHDNPLAFRPRDDRMALFHARLGADLDRAPSRYYAHALDYFHGRLGWDQWEFVGYQGIAEVACRHDDVPLAAAIAQLPPPPLIALCHCLESQLVAVPLRDALLHRLDVALRHPSPDVGELAALIRGLSSQAGTRAVRERIAGVLAHPAAGDVELLAALSGRAWEALQDRSLLDLWLARLADNAHGQAAFTQCVADLVGVPEMSATLRAALRDPNHPNSVRRAVSRMTEKGAGRHPAA